MSNVEKVVADELCTGCGTCVAVCPFEAISIKISDGLLLPIIDEDKCIGCKKCLECCPGPSVDLHKMNSEIFGRQPEDPILGNFLKCYVGHSNDREIRGSSSSGGIVTHLLVYALEKGLIDGAIVARMKKDDPLKSEVFVARSRDEIISASKSKYCPVATNTVLKSVLGENGRFAIVGLPCHMHGIRMAEALSNILENRIVLHVGLFCGHTVNFEGTEALVAKLKINIKQVERIDYRGSGWPGLMSIRLKDGKERQIRFNKGWKAYWNLFSPFFFTPLRCLMCPDLFNEVSDISVGDAWLSELVDHKSGEAVIVTRSEFSEKLISSMINDETLALVTVSASKAKESQTFSLNFKKDNLADRLRLLKSLGKETPEIDPRPEFSSYWSFASGLLSYASYVISSSVRLKRMLVYAPLPLLRIYFGLLKCSFFLSQQRRLG